MDLPIKLITDFQRPAFRSPFIKAVFLLLAISGFFSLLVAVFVNEFYFAFSEAAGPFLMIIVPSSLMAGAALLALVEMHYSYTKESDLFCSYLSEVDVDLLAFIHSSPEIDSRSREFIIRHLNEHCPGWSFRNIHQFPIA